jgi:hypothetical protein
MSRFTKALRQKIVKDFAIKHNGIYNPTLFLEEVRRSGPSHPAYDWFEWDRDRAAAQYQVEQARNFARDLRVSFKVEVINGGRRSIQVRETAMPLVLSPVDGRRSGGGYVLTDENDPAHMIEHCRQAAMALRAWLSRYRSAGEHAGCDLASLEAVVKRLEETAPQTSAAA